MSKQVLVKVIKPTYTHKIVGCVFTATPEYTSGELICYRISGKVLHHVCDKFMDDNFQYFFDTNEIKVIA